MLTDSPDQREQALSLHNAGRLDEAQAVYEALLEAAPEDPDLLGLLGVVAMQQDRGAAARRLFRRALDAGGAPAVRLRNLNNYLVLIQGQGTEEEAQTLVAAGVPDWPEGVVPDRADRAMVLSLAEALLLLGRPEQAARLMARAVPEPGADAIALSLTGRSRLAAGDAEGAAAALDRAVGLAPGDQRALIALGAALDRLGLRAEAAAAGRAFATRFPFHSEPRRDGQTATILVLNPVPGRIPNPDMPARGLHFRTNFPAQLARLMAERYRFQSVFDSIAPEARPWEGEGADVVLNNLVNEEASGVPDRDDPAPALVERIGLPVINAPDHMARITRQNNAELLTGIPGLKVPRITRYRLADTDLDAIAADIGGHFDYPVILRQPGAHMSAHAYLKGGAKTAYLVADERELRDTLAETEWTEFHAIEFVNLRKTEGWYRKIRATLIGGEVIVSSGGFYSEWLTSGWFSRKEGAVFYRANPDTLRQVRAFLEDPEGELGSACLATLQRIRERLPMDILGIDFDVDDAGQVVFFEASAGMSFQHPTNRVPRDLWLPVEPLQRVHAAFHDLVARRIAEGVRVRT